MEDRDIFYIVIGVLFLLIILITGIFSLTILIILLSNWHTKFRSISNLLITNSCIAFLVFALCLSIQIPSLFQNNQQTNNDHDTIFCRFRACLFLFACIAKVFSYLIQAISRYFIIILYKHKNLLTYRMNGLMIGLSWMFSLILSSCMFISPIAIQYESESRLCVLTTKVFHTAFTLMCIVFVIPVSIIVLLYGHILWHTSRNNRIQPNAVTTGNSKRNIKVFQNILFLIMIVILGGGPYFLSIIINKISRVPWPLYSISILFIALSAIAETLTIFFTNKEVKTTLYAKLGLREQREAPTLPLVPMTMPLTNQMRTNIRPTIAQIH